MERAELASDAPQMRVDSLQSNGSTTEEAAAPPDRQLNPWAPDEGRYVSLEEYWVKWYENPYPDMDVSYEWNNGRLEAKPLPNPQQLELYNWFLDLLRRYLSTHDIANLINLETGIVLTMEDAEEPSGERVQVRKPDIGVILRSNPTPWRDTDHRHFGGVCDLIVEAVSDSSLAEVLRDTEEKRTDYALGGVQEYYILDPSGEHMHFYRLTLEDSFEEIPPDDQGVIHSEILPGLQFRHSDLWRQPRLEELALDEVYSGFVIPTYQVAVNRAEEAESLVEAESQRADAEAQRADAGEEAHRQAAKRVQELEAELARLRQRKS